MAKGKITYSKTERVVVELDEDDIIRAVRRFLSNKLDIPEGADIDWRISQGELVNGVTISWTENADPTEEDFNV
jgi:hypothetical protein